MSSNTRELVTLGADIGGTDAFVATHDLVLYLRRLLKQNCRGPYGTTVKEFALVLRIDGSIQAWGKKGAEAVRFQQKNTYVTVEIFVPTDSWSGVEEADIRKTLAAGVTDAIESVVKVAERKRIEIDGSRLRNEAGEAAKQFLDFEGCCHSSAL